MKTFLAKLIGCYRKYYNIIAIHQYKCIYFAIPKVANTSFKGFIAEILKDEIPKEFQNDGSMAFPFKNDDARAFLRTNKILIDFDQAKALRGYWRFCIVRNPWDRLVSCFNSKIKEAGWTKSHVYNGVYVPFDEKFKGIFYPGMTFQAFIDAVADVPDKDADRHFRPQHLFVTDHLNRLHVDFVGYLERLAEDLAFIRNKCGFPPHIQFPHLGKGKKPKTQLREYYTDSMIEKVGRRFEADIKMFGYGFDSLPPPRYGR